MTVSIYSLSTLTILLLTPVVSSYTFCSWKPANINTDPNAQLSFQCTDPSTQIIIIENAIIAFAYYNGSCTTFIGCSQQVTDFAQYCTGYNKPCLLNQQAFFTPYASQTCNSVVLNYVSVNYSCIAVSVQPYEICSTQQFLSSSGMLYLSTSSSFPLSDYFPYAPIQCSCSFKPLYQGVTANISIRALVVELWDYTSCSQQLTIRSCPNNDTVFCSRSVSSNVTSYVQLESNPSISFQSNSTQGHFLLEIRTLTSSISGTVGSGTIGSINCGRNVVPSCGVNSSSTSVKTTSTQSVQTTIPLTSTIVSRLQTSHTSQLSNVSSNIFTVESSIQTGTPDNRPTSIPTIPISSQVVSQASPASAHGDPNVSGGAIAGIVIGCVVFVILLVVILVVLLRNRRKSGSKPRHKSLSNEKLSNDQSNGTGLTSSNGVAALRRHEPIDYNTESMTGSASNLKPDRADNNSGVYDIPASAYNLESIKNEKLAKQKARTQAYEMKPLPNSNSENSKQNRMIGSSTLTLMPTHEVDGRSGNINMGSGLNTSKTEGAGWKGNGSHQDDRSNNGPGGRDKTGANQDSTSIADAKLKPRTDSELMLVDNNLYTFGAVANQSTLAGEAKLKPLSDSELMLVDNNLYLDGAETRAIMEHF